MLYSDCNGLGTVKAKEIREVTNWVCLKMGYQKKPWFIMSPIISWPFGDKIPLVQIPSTHRRAKGTQGVSNGHHQLTNA